MTNDDHNFPEQTPNHWQLIRDVAVFQFKLALDGVRDVVLVPISLAAGIAGLIISPDNPGKYFNRLLELGRRSDVWINLFSATEHYQTEEPQASSDAYVEKLEKMLINEYKRGGMVKNLKDHTDHLMKRIQSEVKQDGQPKNPPD